MQDKKCREEYLRRIHKVQDYIEKNMGHSMSQGHGMALDELAGEAGFSKYHFSRIFQGILQESVAHYVNRIRMENALFLLAHRMDKNITDIAYELGLSDSAAFSRVFKNYYGISPREYRQEYSKNCKDSFLLSAYNMDTAKKEWTADLFPVKGKITLQHLESKQTAYVRHTGTYETLASAYGNLIETLFVHAEEQKLLIDGQNQVLAIYHDNPEFGEEKQFRTSLCLTVPANLQIREDGILGRMELEGGLYAVGSFQIRQEQYPDAWNYMYQEWITGSGYFPRNVAPFEVYRKVPAEGGDGVHEVDIYVPIEPVHY